MTAKEQLMKTYECGEHDLQLAVTLSPRVEIIVEAMEEYAESVRGSRTLSAVPSEEYIKDFSPIDYFNMEKVVKLYCEKHKCQIISNEAYGELCGRGIAG